MTPEEFRRAGYAMIDWIASYRESLHERAVVAPARPGDIKAMLPVSPPQDPEPMDAILRDFDVIARHGITNWQHPRFAAYFPGNSLLAGVVADLASTGLGVVGLTWAASPAVTELEEVMLECWGTAVVGRSRSLDFFVGQLRSKLAGIPLHTVRGFGYRLDR